MPPSGQDVLPSVNDVSGALNEEVVDAVNVESGVNSEPVVTENIINESGDIAVNVEIVEGVSGGVLTLVNENLCGLLMLWSLSLL